MVDGQGTKHDTGKARYDLIPPEALEALAQVYTFGCKKYDDRNWEKGIKFSRLFAAIMRHSWAYWSGETFDKETCIHHMAHAAFGCFALVTFELRNKKDLDDRK